MADIIRLSEIVSSINNVSQFKRKYGVDYNDEKIKKIFDRFNSQQPRLNIKDIFGYGSIDDLISAINTTSKKETSKEIKKSEVNVIVDNERVLVVEPLTMAASIKYGANTKWCTAAEEEGNKFDEYYGKVSLIYFIDKIHNEKYAVAWSSKLDQAEAFDERDVAIDPDRVFGKFRLDPDLVYGKVVGDDVKIVRIIEEFRENISERTKNGVIEGGVLFNIKVGSIKEVLDFSNLTVNGNFFIDVRGLTSLVGSPKIVTGNFTVASRGTTSLQGSPEKVGMNFICDHNDVESLVGGPQYVGQDFRISNCNLKSLIGSPKKVGGNFVCDDNIMKDLIGFPRELKGGFYCRYNEHLISLRGSPKTINGSFVFADCNVESLLGGPEEVKGDFNGNGNSLSSLDGIPKVGGDIYLHMNKVKFSREDTQKTQQTLKENIFMDKKTDMPHYFEYYQDLMEGTKHCVMVGLPKFNKLTEFIKSIPEECIFHPERRDFGREKSPHITVLYGVLTEEEEEKAKAVLGKIPGKLVATLGATSLFENCNDPEVGKFDVLKIDVQSPQLANVNNILRKSVKFENDYDAYKPHVTIAYLKPGMGKKFTDDKRFQGMKFLFEVFLYGSGNRDELENIPMLAEYFVGQSGGYGASGGPIASPGWAGNPGMVGGTTKHGGAGNDGRRASYMNGNTVVNNSLYDTIRPEDLKHPKFKPDDIMTGLRWEMKRMEYPDKTRAKPVVIANLEKDPHYYSALGQYHMDGKY